MKAKEYAQVIIDANFSNESIHKLANDLTNEICEIATSRKCRSDSALNAVFKEMDQKYRAICTIVNKEQNIMKVDGYKECLKLLYKDSPNVLKLEYFKPKYVMGVDLASGPDFSCITPGNTLEQRLTEQTEKRLLDGAYPDSKPRGLMNGQQIPSTR